MQTNDDASPGSLRYRPFPPFLIPPPASSFSRMAPYFNFERLDVYRASLALLGEIRKLAASIPRGNADLHDQLRRAATSINLNIAEGSGERSTKEKARFYRMALRSAHEAAAALYSLVWLAGLPATEIEPALKLLHRIAAMLTRMAGVGREQTG